MTVREVVNALMFAKSVNITMCNTIVSAGSDRQSPQIELLGDYEVDYITARGEDEDNEKTVYEIGIKCVPVKAVTA